MEARYTDSLLKTDEGFSVWVPGLPGCAIATFVPRASNAAAMMPVQRGIREFIHCFLFKRMNRSCGNALGSGGPS